MDNGWDHTENEDKVLLNQSWDLGQTNITGVIENRHIKRVNNCNNIDRTGGYELVSLSGEYGKHLSSVVLNNYNLLFGLSPTPFVFPVLIYYIYQLCYLYSCISEISKICDSDCKCICNCKCVPECTGNTICLCVCDFTKGGSGSCCCICICKKDKCKCVCICICSKAGATCGCEPGAQHQCKGLLVKVDIGTLKDKTCEIINELCCILCYISRLESKCCLCSCCEVKTCDTSCCSECPRGSSAGCCCCSCSVNGKCNEGSCEPYCCCKKGTIDYLSIKSKINRIQYLFKQVGTKILELTKMNKTLTIYCNKQKPEGCQCCNCKEKVDSLINNIEKAGEYYSSFASVIGDIQMLVDYKTFSPQANEIIEKLKFSVKPLLNQLSLINHQTISNAHNSITFEQLLLVVYSHYCIFQCFLGLYILLQSSSNLGSIIYIIQRTFDCYCLRQFEIKNNNIRFEIPDFYKYLIHPCNKDIDDLKKLGLKDGNHLCLCMVIKYVLYPYLIRSVYYLRQIYLDALGKQTREFVTNNHLVVNINYITKLFFILMNLIYKISIFMEHRYLWTTSKIKPVPDAFCFCRAPDDPYYPYLISIILFVSSLVENMWSMDTESVRMSIECLSSLLSEYQSLHVYTNYGSGNSKSNVSSSTDSSNLNLSLMTSTQYTKKISITTHSKNGTCNSTGNGNSSMILHTQMKISEAILVNKSVKTFFKSVISSLSILIGTPFFALVYSNISGLAFYIIQNSKIIGVSSGFLRTGLITISHKYLKCTETKKCTCKVKNGCKICVIFKINYLSLSITMKMVKYVLASFITNLITTKSKSFNVIITDMSRIIINDIEMILRMSKNNLLTQSNNDSNYLTISTTGIDRRNWGYDTLYEHVVTTLSNHKLCPKLLTVNRGTIDKIQNIVTH